MNKFVVYTAIFNDYDWLKDPVIPNPCVDYICYTDSDKIASSVWKVVRVSLSGLTPIIMNRRIKLLYPFSELKNYDYSLYVDGSVMIKGNFSIFLEKYLAQKPILMNFKHPNNDCIYEEMIRCVKQGRGNAHKLFDQYVKYVNDEMPMHYGLSDNKIILRDNHSELCKTIMEEWYDEVVNYSGRDQVCLSYVLYKHNMQYVFFDESIIKNDFFETWPHNTDSKKAKWWRRFKWFCERKQILLYVVSFLEKKVKPKFIK